MLDQTAFLQRVKTALRQAGEAGFPRAGEGSIWTTPGGAGLSPDGAGEEPGEAERFLKEWELVGGHGHRLGEGVAVGAKIAEIATSRGARSLIMWDRQRDSLLAAAYRELSAAGFEVKSVRGLDSAALRTLAAKADLGVVAAYRAIAATGTVVLVGAPGQARAVGLLPPTLCVIVRRAVIRPTLRAVLLEIGGSHHGHELPQNLSLVTGPSKSADIGLELVTNVHGPGDVHALVLDGGGTQP